VLRNAVGEKDEGEDDGDGECNDGNGVRFIEDKIEGSKVGEVGE
jgi:hypothetical protein